VLVSCVDNLLKGSAGQAVQNMNLMYQWEEREGLQ
jgi:N-acetyl-gamma-glutamyl-phosphate reductase